MKEWKEHSVADLIKSGNLLIGDGYRAKNSELSNSGIPFARVSNINNGFHFEGANLFPIEDLKKVGEKISIAGDIVFTSKGTVGRFAFVKEGTPQFVYSPQLCYWRSRNQDLINSKYLFYWMQGREFFEQVEAVKGQTDMADYVNLADQRQMTITLPPLSEQTAIATVLSSLDEKIDLLHRQNKTLEGLAEVVFREWFVERAKSDWEEGTIEDVVTTKGGTTPSTKNPEFWDGDIYWTSPRDLSSNPSVFMFDTSRKITEEGLKKISSGLMPVGTVLLSSRAPIGYLAITEIPVAINQGYIAIICDKVASNYFMYLWCKANMDEIENAGNGSVFQEISKASFKSLEITIPPKTTMEEFDAIVKPFFEKIKTNTQQIRTLTGVRDTLLPKVMSGEVRVGV
jgi:type I restriction enzyme, S subunit